MKLFRAARPASPGWNVAKTLVQIVVVWGFALGLLPAITVTAEDLLDVPRWGWDGRVPFGIALFLAGSTCGLTSAWLMATIGEGTPVPFDAARTLVVAGPYRVIRNPMAVSAINQLLGIAAALGSAGCVVLAIGGGVVWHLGIRPSEERYLAASFGAPYERYRAAVRCWIPRWPPYVGPSGAPMSRRDPGRR